MRTGIISRQWVFAALVLGMTITSLIYSYPGGFKETIDLSKQVVALVAGE
jgi:hypothetical protein